VDTIYISGRYCFPLVCTFKKAIKNFEVKCRCTKGGYEVLIINLRMNVFVSSNSHFYPLLSYGDSPQ
jgi:hypothetical protein